MRLAAEPVLGQPGPGPDAAQTAANISGSNLFLATMCAKENRPNAAWAFVLSHNAWRSTGAKDIPDQPLLLINDASVFMEITGPVCDVLDAAFTKIARSRTLKKKELRHAGEVVGSGTTHTFYNIHVHWYELVPINDDPHRIIRHKMHKDLWMVEFDCANRLATVCSMSER